MSHDKIHRRLCRAAAGCAKIAAPLAVMPLLAGLMVADPPPAMAGVAKAG